MDLNPNVLKPVLFSYPQVPECKFNIAARVQKFILNRRNVDRNLNYLVRNTNIAWVCCLSTFTTSYLRGSVDVPAMHKRCMFFSYDGLRR